LTAGHKLDGSKSAWGRGAETLGHLKTTLKTAEGFASDLSGFSGVLATDNTSKPEP
jgi:hypothetical protein